MGGSLTTLPISNDNRSGSVRRMPMGGEGISVVYSGICNVTALAAFNASTGHELLDSRS